jgi:hypothetical protein
MENIRKRTLEMLLQLHAKQPEYETIGKEVEFLFEEIKAGGAEALRIFGAVLVPLDDQPLEYAFVELFGHNCLGACAVREVRRFGAIFCEASPLDGDGKPGRSRLIQGSSIYSLTPIDKDTALSVAKRRLGYLPAQAESRNDPPPIDAEFTDTGLLALFLRENTEQGDDKEVVCTVLFDAYTTWCVEQGVEAVSKRAFADHLADIASLGNTGSFRVYRGLTLTATAIHDYVRPQEETLAERIEQARIEVAQCERDLELKQNESSLYDHEEEMLEAAKERLQELLEEQAESGGEPSDPPVDHDDQSQAPAFKRDPVPAGCESCPGCPDCLTSTPSIQNNDG